MRSAFLGSRNLKGGRSSTTVDLLLITWEEAAVAHIRLPDVQSTPEIHLQNSELLILRECRLLRKAPKNATLLCENVRQRTNRLAKNHAGTIPSRRVLLDSADVRNLEFYYAGDR
jgi:hypothetical protein